MPIRNQTKGFTLVETIIVIVTTGIVASIVAVFIKQPIDAYFDNSRRAALTDEADTALRRMARDIHKALPNSVRQANNQCIEFIPTKFGGRYRAALNASGNGDALDFTTADTSFDMFGLNSALPADQQIVANDVVAVYNLGVTGANAYAGNNISTVTSVANGSLTNESKINIVAKQFPLASGNKRFHVIPNNEAIVSFICSGGRLYRNANYAYSASCPAPTPGITPILARHVESCSFTYNAFDLQRNGLVQMTITLIDGGERVRLYHEAHVNNFP